MKKGVNKSVTKLCKALKKAGFVVHRLDAVTTDSIYLKLDYGVFKSIRISDHPGKSKYKYTFNLYAEYSGSTYKVDRGVDRYYFQVDDLRNILISIFEVRNALIKHYGQESIDRFISMNKKTMAEGQGFWARSYEVK